MFFKKTIVKEKPPQAKRIDNLLTNITFFHAVQKDTLNT